MKGMGCFDELRPHGRNARQGAGINRRGDAGAPAVGAMAGKAHGRGSRDGGSDVAVSVELH